MPTTLSSKSVPTQANAQKPETQSSGRMTAALPRFRTLTGAAYAVGVLPVAVLFLMGRTWPAISIALGVGMSLGVCGLLFLFVERIMPAVFGAARSGAAGMPGSQPQFLIFLGAKLAFIALVGAVFLSLHSVNSLGVIAGFLLGQTAIVVSAIRFRK
jgi:hypothetical protein